MKIINELDIRNMIRAVLIESRDIPWDEIDKLLHLGTMKDSHVARTVGALDMGTSSLKDATRKVTRRRRSLGIRAFIGEANPDRMGLKYVGDPELGAPWDKIDPLFATMSNVNIVRKIGFERIANTFASANAYIGNRRSNLGIPKHEKPRTVTKSIGKSRNIPWDEIDPLFQTMSNASIVREIGFERIANTFSSANVYVGNRRSNLGIAKHEKVSRDTLAAIDSLFSTMSNIEIVRKLGYERIRKSPQSASAYVGKRRSMLGLPKHKKVSQDIPWDEIDRIIGTMPDEYVAEDFSIPVELIHKRREHLGYLETRESNI